MGGGERPREEPNHTTARKPGSLLIIQYSMEKTTFAEKTALSPPLPTSIHFFLPKAIAFVTLNF